jgi:hypothetical protein
MNVEQPCKQRYSGVTWHEKKWLVKFRCNGKDLNLGHYKEPELAAWVADFARYMCFGLNPGHWHHNVGRPNFPPRTRLDFPRVLILRKLLQLKVLKPEILWARLADYDAVVEQNTVCCAYS